MSNQKNDIGAMREILFETLRGVKDGSIEVEKAKAICETSQAIINSVKVEIDFSRTTGLQPSSEFIPTQPLPKPEQKPAMQNLREKGILPNAGGIVTTPAPGHTVHRMRG